MRHWFFPSIQPLLTLQHGNNSHIKAIYSFERLLVLLAGGEQCDFYIVEGEEGGSSKEYNNVFFSNHSLHVTHKNNKIKSNKH